MYEQLRFEIRDGLVEIINHYPTGGGALGQPRAKKREKTPEEMEKANRRQRAKNLQRLIMANFEEGDFHLVLKYKEAPATYADAKKDLQRFLAAMCRSCKKAGYEFKYIGVTERGKKKAALHHHLIVEDRGGIRELVRKHWKGHCAWNDLYEEGNFKDLADYLLKKETKEENAGTTYTRSRNLRIPKCKKVKYKRRKWPETPRARKGWYVVKSSLYEGENGFTGLPYQTYLTKKVNKEETCRQLTSTPRPPGGSTPKRGGRATSSSTRRKPAR